jgi:membrane-bound lytic murein transglycosylase F
MADNGDIQYLICDYYQAITLMPFYSNVKILDNAGPQFERRWILNKKNVQLNDQINRWLLDFKNTKKYSWLLKKYFSQESSIIHASFSRKSNIEISQYDAIIKKYAEQYHFDWRFVASIICQESKFISGLTGRGGSYGLMQLMPVTMDYYGISEDDGEEAVIRVGVQHLNSLRKAFEDVSCEVEKLYFVAAAYNAGRGHIFDARRLCAKYEEDYKKWKDVSKYLKLKSQREYATDPLVKSGYFPGAQAVRYTQHVMERYYGYKAAYP